MITRENISDIATGQWHYIHPALGVPLEWMTKTGKPCLMCGGHDRSSYDDLEGRGTYLCRQCGAGDGFTLLQKFHAWDFKQAANEVRRVLGITSRVVIQDKGPLPKPPPKPPKTFCYAKKIWQQADTHDNSVASHPYATRKRIRHAAGAARANVTGKLVGRDANCLVVPMRALDGAFKGVECINPDGVKQSFGSKGVLILGNDLDPALPQLIVEGWATAAAILNLYQWNACVYAAFGKGMLEKLACQIAEKYPQRTIIIGGEADA